MKLLACQGYSFEKTPYAVDLFTSENMLATKNQN